MTPRTSLFAAALLASCGGTTPQVTAPTVEPAVEPAPAPEPPAEPTPHAEPEAPKGYTGLGAESISSEMIQKFAAPPLDHGVSARIQSMLDIRGTGGGAVTSKGDRIVFTWSITGTPQVWRQDGPLKFPIQLTGGEDRTSVVGLTHDDKWIVVSRDVGGSENPGLYLQSIEGGPLVEIQHKEGIQTAFQALSEDGRWLYYRSNDVEPSSYALYRYDLQTKQKETVWSEPGLWSIEDLHGERMLLSKATGALTSEIYELDVAAKKLTPLIGHDEKEEYDVRFGAKPGTFVVQTNKLGDFRRLYELAGGKLTPITPEIKYDVAWFVIDDPRTRIVYIVNEGGYRKTHALDAKTKKPLALPKLPAADNVTGGATTHNGRFTTFTYDGATMPSTSVTYDWKLKKLITWRVPSTPEVDVATFAKVSLEEYPARDGTKIPMLVRRPAKCAQAADPCPVVVSFHGGPEGQSVAGFNPAAQVFVDAGFIFVEPNVRGSMGYGKAWLSADDGAKRLDIITDIQDAGTYIKEAWAKNGKAPKVGVLGGSYGGYSTLFAMTYFAGTYDAGVSHVGISNLVTFLMNTAPYRRILRISEYGDPEKDREVLIKLSPITYIDRVKAPLLVVQGVNDPRVPVGEAIQMHEALTKRGITSPLILFPDEGHGTAKRANIVLSLGHTLAFFEQHLR